MFEYLLTFYGICGQNNTIRHVFTGINITVFTALLIYFGFNMIYVKDYEVCVVIIFIQFLILFVSYLYVIYNSKLINELNQELCAYYRKYNLSPNNIINIIFIIIYLLSNGLRMHVIYYNTHVTKIIYNQYLDELLSSSSSFVYCLPGGWFHTLIYYRLICTQNI